MSTPVREAPTTWWTRTRLFLGVVGLILFLCLVIVYLATPQVSRGSFWVEVLLAVAGAALVVLFVSLADRLVLLREVSEQVNSVLSTSLDERMIQSPWATGIVGIHDSLSDAGFGGLIENAVDQEICVLDTYIPDPMFFTSKMERALKQRCTFKFLVLNPESTQAKARSALLAKQGLDYAQFTHGINIYICTIAGVCHQQNAYDRIKIRFYDEPPATPLYIFRSHRTQRRGGRDRLIVGFYLDTASYASPHLEVARVGHPVFELFEDYFKRVWDRNESREIPIADYLKDSCPIGFIP
jgi:hypothetical protein